MPTYKSIRTGEDFRREITHIISGLKDPRVNGSLVSVTRVELSTDLSYAKIFVSSIDGVESAKTAAEGLKSASGFIKKRLSETLKLRKIPSLKFIPDDSISKSAEIIKIINSFDKGNGSDS